MMKIASISLGLFVASDAIEDKPKKTLRQQITAEAHRLNMGGVAAVAGAAIGAGAAVGNMVAGGALDYYKYGDDGAEKADPAKQSATTQFMVDHALQGKKSKLVVTKGTGAARRMRLERDITVSGDVSLDVTSSAACGNHEYYMIGFYQNTSAPSADFVAGHGSCGSLYTGVKDALSATTAYVAAVSTVSTADTSGLGGDGGDYDDGTAITLAVSEAMTVVYAFSDPNDGAYDVEASDVTIGVDVALGGISVTVALGGADVAVETGAEAATVTYAMGSFTLSVAEDGDISAGDAVAAAMGGVTVAVGDGSSFASSFDYEGASAEVQAAYNVQTVTVGLQKTEEEFRQDAIAACALLGGETDCEVYVSAFGDNLPTALEAAYPPQVDVQLSGESTSQLSACLIKSSTNSNAGPVGSCQLRDYGNLDVATAATPLRSSVFSVANECVANPNSYGCNGYSISFSGYGDDDHGDDDDHGHGM